MQPRIVFIPSMYPDKQVHFANPFDRTVHCVLGPQGEGSHGFCGIWHGTSGGLPSNSERQKHVGRLLTILHPLFGPQLFGTHSLPSSGTEINNHLLSAINSFKL